MTIVRTLGYGLLCSSVFLAAMPAAAAQADSPPTAAEPAPPPGTDVTDAGAAEPAETEIVVTAQRRNENLQDVPIAVTAITPERTERLNLRDLGTLQQVTPGLVFTTGISYSQTYIRGIGSSLTNPGLEPAVATYIDGAYLERGFGALFDVLDPSTIQVLKGPQGTLWGRNATGGAVLLNTADPVERFGARVLGEIGNLDHRLIEGVVNLPLSETLSARVAARYREDGGYVRNLVDGFKFGARENWTVRGKLAFRPNDDFSAIAQFQYDKSKRTPGANAQFLETGFCAFCAASTFSFPLASSRTTVGNVINGGVGGRDRSPFANLRMNYDLGRVALSSTTAYRKTENFETGDFDFTEIGGFNLIQRSGAKTFTQDLTLSTQFDGMVNAIAGLSYLRDKSHFNLGFFDTDDLPPPPLNIGNNQVKTRSLSGFAEVTVEPMAGLKLIGGGRYTHDERRLVAIDKTSFNSFTPRFVVSYDTGPLNLYASYNRGFKAGGFNTPAPPAVPVRPEKIRSYEAGAKFQSADRRLRANLAVFHYNYSDVQVTTIDQASGEFFLQNAARAKGDGFELEGEFRPVRALQLFGGLSYLKARYSRFSDAQIQQPLFDLAGNPAGLAVGVEDLSGFPLTRAPKWSGHLGATLAIPLSRSWKGELTGFAHYSSTYDFAPGAAGPLRADRQPGFTTAKLSGRVMSQDDRYELGFYVDNLTDKTYYDFRFTTAPFGAMQILARPRTYGLRAGVRF